MMNKKRLVTYIILFAILALSVTATIIIQRNVSIPDETEPEKVTETKETAAEDLYIEETSDEIVDPVTFTALPDVMKKERSIIRSDHTEIRKPTAEEAEKYPQFTNLPTLYIELDGKMKVGEIHRNTYTGATLTLVDGDTGIYSQRMQIKGRGNYSWSFPQKPYNLKLDEDTNLLGMGAAKMWVLITTHSDKTLMRNFNILSLAYNIGMEYAVETRYVDVFVNGEYNGLYVLSEKIELDSERIQAEALMEIEMQYRHSDCSRCIICPSGCHITYKQPETSHLTAEENAALLKKYTQLFIEADVALTKGIEYYSQFIDVDSFVDWYIVNELVKNYDSNFTTSCYCYVKDGKIHMGPCWDYDTCMGNQNAATCMYPEGYHVATGTWYSILTNDEGFKNALHKRWTELVEKGYLAAFRESFVNTPEIIKDSEKADHDKWKQALKSTDLRGGLSKFTYEEEVDYLINWLDTRVNWLDERWNNNWTPPKKEY